MTTVAEAITHGRRAITQLEPTILADLLRSYEQVWWQTERTIMQFEAQIQAAIDAGQTVKPSWVRQQTWYRQVQGSIDDQFVRFNHTALSSIVRGQSQAVGISTEATTLFRQAVGIETSLAGRVNVGAFERWVSAVQPNSPIRGVIDKYGERTQEAILRHVTDGIGGGQGIGQIVRNITKDAGPDAAGGRLQTMVRTETLRAYRGSSRDGFEAIGPDVISEWEWMATKSSRTCLACIAMDGRRFPYDRYPNRFHVSCRCVIRPVPHANLVPGALPQRELGSDWLARQDESVQRQMIGTEGRWNLYQDGAPLTDFVGIKRSRTWGDSLYVKPAGAVQVPDIEGPKARTWSARSTDTVDRQYRRDVKAARDPSFAYTDSGASWEEYKGTGYRETNAYLRGTKPASQLSRSVESQQQAIADMDAAFVKFKLDGDTEVYRGTSFVRGSNPEPDGWRTLQPGSVVTDDAYLSTTYDPDVAERFGFGQDRAPGTTTYGFRIRAGDGTPYMPADAFPPGEAEMVFPRGSQLRVTNVTRTPNESGDGAKVIVDADLVPGEVPE